MLYDIFGELVEPVVGRDYLVVFAEQVLQQGLLIRVEVDLLDGVGDSVVEIEAAMPSFSPRFS